MPSKETWASIGGESNLKRSVNALIESEVDKLSFKQVSISDLKLLSFNNATKLWH